MTHRLVICTLTLILALGVTLGVTGTEVHTAMPEGARVSFSCDSASWIKEDLKKVDIVISLGTQLGDLAGGASKYTLANKGKELTILNLEASDSGIFKCQNFKYFLTVAKNPTCSPTLETLKEGVEKVITCGDIITSGSVAPRVNWLIAKQIVHSFGPKQYMGKDTAAETSPAIDYALIPKFSDNGKSLSCVLEYDNWNTTFPKPRCGISAMDIKFEPRIECPEIQYLNENNSRHLAFCEVLGNPRPNEESIFWKTDNNDRVYLDRKDRKQEIKDLPYGIRASLILTHAFMSQNMTVNVPHGGQILKKRVAPILVSGPYLTCPRSIKVRRDNKIEIMCEVRAQPWIPFKNITWTQVGEKAVKQKESGMQQTVYGEDITMVFDLTKFVERDDENAMISVEVVGIFVTAKKAVTVILKDNVSVEETISSINSWVNRNAGLLLMSGALFLIALLTFVVIVVSYRKGLLCGPPSHHHTSYNKPISHNARIPSATLLDALNDLEYKAARGTNTAGNRRSSFTFYPGTVNSASVPLTMGRDAVDNFEWSHGFSKLANALIAKDTDQDGYIQSHDAMATVKTYSQIYKLNLDDSTIHNAMQTCSNGAHVDVESLTRLLANAHDVQQA